MAVAGTSVHVWVDWEDENGAPFDPDTVTLVYRKPDGSLVTVAQVQLTNPYVGRWEYWIATTSTQDGDWAGTFVGHTAVPERDVVSEFQFSLESSLLASAGGTDSFLPCQPWCTEADMKAPCDAYEVAGDALWDAILSASWVLYELSGRQFPGVCTSTIRPAGTSYPGYYDAIHGKGGMCGPACTHRVSKIALPGGPVHGVNQVLLDGVVLDPSEYAVDRDRWLIRLADSDGRARWWPCTQRIDLPTTELRTMEITYTHGLNPPPMGVRANAKLACELMIASDPTVAGTCQLPERVTTIARQGVTAVVLDPFSFLEKGRTGLYEVDLFLAAVNPGGISRPATVTTPSTLRRRHHRLN